METEDDKLFSAQPDKYIPVGVKGLLAATSKALALNRGVADPDHRDGFAYKRIHTPADLMAERVALGGKNLLRKMMYLAAKRKDLQGITSGFMTPLVEEHLVGNPLATPLEQINPLDELGQARRVTLMGPGGLRSDDLITADMQAVSPSSFGFVSAIEGPESSRAGVDLRMSNGVRVGTNGRLYQQFRNPKTGHLHWLAPEDLHGKVVGMPYDESA